MSDLKMGGETHLSPRSTEKGLNYNKVAAGFPLSSVWAPPLNHTGVFCRIDLHWTRSSKGLIKKWKRPFRNAFCSNYMIRNKVAAFQCGSRRPRCHSWRSPSIKASMGGRLAPDNIFVIRSTSSSGNSQSLSSKTTILLILNAMRHLASRLEQFCQ